MEIGKVCLIRDIYIFFLENLKKNSFPYAQHQEYAQMTYVNILYAHYNL